MVDPLNPQREEMADESMVRNLAAQADAIWPQEQALFTRYGLDTVLADLERPTRAKLLAAMQGHVLQTAELIGTYKRP